MSLSLLLAVEETYRLCCKVVAFIFVLFPQGGDIEYKGDPLQDFTLMR